jgi:hypothetical protein
MARSNYRERFALVCRWRLSNCHPPIFAGRIPKKFLEHLREVSRRVATVALASKTARIVWAIMTRGDVYRSQHIPVLATWSAPRLVKREPSCEDDVM